jgi:hypothetical protein
MPDPPFTTLAPPRRSRWRRRLLVLGLLLATPAAGLWAWAAWRLYHDSGEAELAAVEADCLDPGWRLEELEAKRDDPPPAENGALKVLAWAKALPRGEALLAADNLLIDWPPEARLNELQTVALRTVLEPAGPTLDEIRTLPRYSRGRYPVQWAPNPIDSVLPCQDARTVAGWLRADAVLRAEAGDTATALADCRAVFQVSRTVGDEPTGISQLVRISLRAVGVVLLERVLAQGEPPADGLAELQRWLEADEPAPLLLVMARGERAAFMRTADEFYANLSTRERLILGFTPSNGPSRARAAGLRFFNAYVEAARLPSPQWVPRLTELAATLKPGTTPVLLDQLMPNVAKMAEMIQRSYAQMRCAIAAVAAERFRRDKGRWPESLTELVAAGLLPAVPADPFDGEPLRLKWTADGLIVYTVGPGGRGDGSQVIRRETRGAGISLGFQLWDPAARRQPATTPAREGR